MISGQSIIYFGPEKWDGMWRNRHHLMSRFARCNKVLYVEPALGFNKLRRRLLDPKRPPEHAAPGPSLVTQVSDNLFVYHSPDWIPIFGRFPLSKISTVFWNALLRRTLARLGMKAPIIWLSRPNMGGYIGAFNEKMRIYHVVDEYLAYGNLSEAQKAVVAEMENRVIDAVDMVVVVSKALYDAKHREGQSTHIVQNGVDVQAYSNALEADAPRPEDLAAIQGPLLGYSGLISARLDLALLHRIATAHPEYNIVLMGQINDRGCAEAMTRLQNMPNVHFLGPKPITDVPRYVKAFDVCLVPYALNDETRNLDALKIYDYLAAGKPVVTTNIPAVNRFRDVAYLADTDGEYLACIRRALSENDISLFDKRRSVAGDNTWEHRVDQLSGILERHLKAA